MSITLQENMVIADRFRLVRMIGRGGMGSVWQALHIGLDTPCALKFIEGEIANVADAHARFEREAKAAAQLRSPHVVQIIDHGVWQGRPYIAMELLEGEDLGKTLLRAGGKLMPSQVNTIIQQVCRALTKAHQSGIVHRDLKPDNIFLVTDDDRQIVKILDFGVAKNTSQAIEGSNTKTGAMLGTPYYMSPEQAQGIKSVDARSDLWSLAVIVYQALTGRLPFESEALGDLLVKIIVQPLPIPSQIASVPPGFDRWWGKASERNPENRFPNAKEFAAALELALGAPAPMKTEIHTATPQLQGTAVLQGQQYQTGMNRPDTPNPNQPGAGLGGGPGQTAFTPHPGNTPPGMVMGQGHHQQQGSVSQNQMGPIGNPATFSGVEPPMMIPKKGLPVGVIAAIAGVVLVCLVGGGIVVVRGRSSASKDDTPPPGSISAATAAPSELPSASASVTAAKTDDPPPPQPPTSASTTGDPTPKTSGAGVVATKPTPTSGSQHHPPPNPTPTVATKPPASAAPSASARPGWNNPLGF